jgi:hypothetical protein
MALGKGNQQGNYGYQGGNNNGNYNNGNNYGNNNQPKRESWGLWVNQSKNGKEYLSFEINGVKYVAFENTNKTSEKSPDYNIIRKDSLQNNGGSFRNNNSGYNNNVYQNGGYTPNNGYVPQQNNGYVQPQQGSEGGSSRNTNVGASEPQNDTYSPDTFGGGGLTL